MTMSAGHPQELACAVLHVPHASYAIPDWVRPQFVLNDHEIAVQQQILVDHHTDDLFMLPTALAATIKFPVSRFVVDPERFERDDLEPMAARGMGVIYQSTTTGATLRRALSSDERRALLDTYYHPHHARLADAVGAAVERHGGCLIIDAHSFAATPLPCDFDQQPNRPDICLGTDSFHTPPGLVSAASSLFQDEGWTVEVDRPFSGTMVPTSYWGREARVWSIMVEINKRLYLLSESADKNAQFEQTRSRIQRAIRGIIDYALSQFAVRRRNAR